MTDVWGAAVKENDALKLSKLVLSYAESPQAALVVVRSCAALLEKEASGRDADREWFEMTWVWLLSYLWHALI